MDFVAFGAGNGPPIEMLSAPDGRRLPYPIRGKVAFDEALARRGWVILMIGSRRVGLYDGELMHPFTLPACRTICPAADASQVLLQRDTAEDEQGEGPVGVSGQAVELVASTGEVLRRVAAPEGRVVGELHAGAIVTPDELVTWEGVKSTLPIAGRALAVCAGRYLAILDGPTLCVFDSETGSTLMCDAPAQRLSSVVHDADGVSVAFPLYDIAALPIVASGQPKVMTLGFTYHSCAWLDSERILVVGDDEHCVLDVRDNSTTQLVGLPKRCHPRVVVTGRFPRNELRTYLRQKNTEPISDSDRAKTLSESREVIVTAAKAAGIHPDSLLDLAKPAVIIHSLPAPNRVKLGTSRLGGRPDLPAGCTWPTNDQEPLTFLAQLRCDELSAALPDARLPVSGLLSFFAPLGYSFMPTHARTVVIHTNQPTLRRLAWPRTLPEMQRLEMGAVSFRPSLTLPDWSDLEDALGEDIAQAVLDALPNRDQPHHQLLGHNSSVQGHPPPADHELLLRLDSDTYLNAMFGDGGSLQIFRNITQPLVGTTECLIDVDSY